MNTKKIIKYLFIGIVGILIGKIIFQGWFDYRPFKFEKYKTSKQFEAALKLKFHVGSDVDQVISLFKKSGAKCYELKSYEEREDCEILAYCEYQASLFSLRSLEGYEAKMYVDKNRKLIELIAWKVPSIIFGT